MNQDDRFITIANDRQVALAGGAARRGAALKAFLIENHSFSAIVGVAPQADKATGNLSSAKKDVLFLQESHNRRGGDGCFAPRR